MPLCGYFVQMYVHNSIVQPCSFTQHRVGVKLKLHRFVRCENMRLGMDVYTGMYITVTCVCTLEMCQKFGSNNFNYVDNEQ